MEQSKHQNIHILCNIKTGDEVGVFHAHGNGTSANYLIQEKLQEENLSMEALRKGLCNIRMEVNTKDNLQMDTEMVMKYLHLKTVQL